jgi:hypothetical protein
MPVALVIGLADPRPNSAHQFVVMGLTIVEATVGFSEGVGLLTGSNEIAFGREP